MGKKKVKSIEDMTLKEFDEMQLQGMTERKNELYTRLCDYHWRAYHAELEDGTLHTSDESRAFALAITDLMRFMVGDEGEDEDVLS